MRAGRNLSVLALAVVMGALAPAVRPTPVLGACVASPDVVTVLEDHTVFVDALGNDSGCNYVTYWTPALHGSLADDPLDDVNNWIYTPDANYSGTDGNAYAATVSGPDESVSEVTYTITPVNDAPVVAVAHPTLVLGEDSGIFTGLLASGDAHVGPGNESDQTLTAVVTANSNPGLFTTAPSAFVHPPVFPVSPWTFRLTFAPKAETSGATTIQVKLTDSGGTANGGADSVLTSIVVIVTPANDPPVAADDVYGTLPGSPLNVPAASGLLANDTDVDSAQLVVSQHSLPQHGALAVNADGSFTYTPAPGFVGIDGFSYRASDGGLYDEGAVTIAVDGTAPTLTSRSPAPGSTGRPRDTQPTISFSDALNAATLTSSTLRLKDKASGTLVPGSIAYDATARRATLRPASLLGAGRTYTLVATNGIKNVSGLAFAGTSWSFTVTSDATRPRIVAKSPAPAATGVSRSSNVSAKFSERVRAATVSISTVRLQDTTTGAIMPATVVYDAGSRKAILDPSTRLSARRTYKVLLSSSIRDRAGNRLRAASWTFKTGG